MGRWRKGKGRTDYLLCVQVGALPKCLPVAVLEAKREAEDPLKGMQQPKGYADCSRHDVKYVFDIIKHKEQLKFLKKEKAADKAISTLAETIRDLEKSARDAQAKADAIDAAVYDLKAVNPNVVAKADSRIPEEIIDSIEAQGKIIATALEKLKTLLAEVD